MTVYSFRPGPSYGAASSVELFDAAFDLPMNLGATFWDQAKGDILESYGLGTAIRSAAIPEGAVDQDQRTRQNVMLPFVNPLLQAYEATRRAIQQRINTDVTPLSEDEWKASPYYREEIPWDARMTEDRAAALASWYDARRVREYFASKRPFTAFIGSLVGQAVDPINYIPIAGQTVRAANIARFGYVRGTAATAALDAAANTAVFGLATRDTRRSFGDDVSWQAMTTEIAMSAMIGGAFGTVAGVLGRRGFEARRKEIEARLSDLTRVQEARIALNEAVAGLVDEGEVRLSPNAIAPIERVARLSENPEIMRPVSRRVLSRPDDAAVTVEEAGGVIQERAPGFDLRQTEDGGVEIVSPQGRRVWETREPLTVSSLRSALSERIEADAEFVNPVIRSAPNEARRVAEASPDQAEPIVVERAAAPRAPQIPRGVDASPPRAEPEPDGIQRARQAIAKRDDYRAIADQYRVNPETGDFLERAEIEQFREEGRLTDEDEAMLRDADSVYEDGVAYGEALKAAVGCLI